MDAQAWISVAVQIPVVVVFSFIVFTMLRMFLEHIDKSEVRYQNFIKNQADESGAAIRELATTTRVAIERLTDSMADDMHCISNRLNELVILDVAHDAFVKTSFKERFGKEAVVKAEEAANGAAQAYVATASKQQGGGTR